MKKLFGLILLMSLSIFAQQDSMILVKKSDIPQNIVQKYENEQNIQKIGKWVGVGKEVGTAMKEGLGALTNETDKFSKTGVGKFTMFIIAYKVLGNDIMRIILGFMLTIIATSMFIWYFITNCKQKTKIEETNNNGVIIKKETPLFSSETLDNRTLSAFILFFIGMLFICLLMFV